MKMIFCVQSFLLMLVLLPWSHAKDCMVAVTDPTTLFTHPDTNLDAIGMFTFNSHEECNSDCCVTEGCNVAVFSEKVGLDETNCLLYSCDPISTCHVNEQEDLSVFVNKKYLDADDIEGHVDDEDEDDHDDEEKHEDDDSGGTQSYSDNLGSNNTQSLIQASQSDVFDMSDVSFVSMATSELFSSETLRDMEIQPSSLSDQHVSESMESDSAMSSIMTMAHDDVTPLLTSVVFETPFTLLPSISDAVENSGVNPMENGIFTTFDSVDEFSIGTSQSPPYESPEATSISDDDIDISASYFTDNSGMSSVASIESSSCADSYSVVASSDLPEYSFYSDTYPTFETPDVVATYTQVPTQESSEQTTLPALPPKVEEDNIIVSVDNSNATAFAVSYQATSEVMTALLICALAFGCIFMLAVVGVLSKRIYDGYRKRHYSRLDYLINGMYN